MPPNMSVRMTTPSPVSTRCTAATMSRRRCSMSSSGPIVIVSTCCLRTDDVLQAARNSVASRPCVTSTIPIIDGLRSSAPLGARSRSFCALRSEVQAPMTTNCSSVCPYRRRRSHVSRAPAAPALRFRHRRSRRPAAAARRSRRRSRQRPPSPAAAPAPRRPQSTTSRTTAAGSCGQADDAEAPHLEPPGDRRMRARDQPAVQRREPRPGRRRRAARSGRRARRRSRSAPRQASTCRAGRARGSARRPRRRRRRWRGSASAARALVGVSSSADAPCRRTAPPAGGR